MTQKIIIGEIELEMLDETNIIMSKANNEITIPIEQLQAIARALLTLPTLSGSHEPL